MGPEAQIALSVAIAALGGAAVGVERQWSGHATGRETRFAGVRTFTLLGALAGVAGAFWGGGMIPLATVLLAGGVALIIAAYIAASKNDVDGTTEAAALVVLAAGTLSGLGLWRAGSGLVAATAFLLAEKSTLHRWVGRITEPGLRAGFRFAVMALIVLPILPAGPYGPLGGIRPQELWALVLFFSGLSFAGYIARSAAGPRGYILAGLLGGLISSTNVTLTFSRNSKKEPAAQQALAVGVLSACSVLYFRVLTACAVLYLPLVAAVWRYLWLPAAVGCAICLLGFFRSTSPAADDATSSPENPLQFRSALQLAGIFQLVLMAVYWARQSWGSLGIFSSAAIFGLTDVDALTISMVKTAQSTGDLDLAARAVALGVLSNTLLKLAVVASLGKATFRTWAALGLFTLAVASALALWFLAPAASTLARHLQPFSL
jgi:uncharacterized membrane protein (DUF4010 family)